MADRVIQRNDTAARWQSINPILATGEIGIEIDGAKGYKIGDGKTRWNDLPYPANPTNVVQELGNNENAVISQKVVSEKLSELGSKDGAITLIDLNDKSLWYVGAINVTTGGDYSDDKRLKTDYIQWSHLGKWVSKSVSTSFPVYCYDINKSYLGFFNNGVETNLSSIQTKYPNTFYIRLAVILNEQASVDIIGNSVTFNSIYTNFQNKEIDNKIKLYKDEYSLFKKDVEQKEGGTIKLNLNDTSIWHIGQIDSTTGKIIEETSRLYSDLIPSIDKSFFVKDINTDLQISTYPVYCYDSTLKYLGYYVKSDSLASSLNVWEDYPNTCFIRLGVIFAKSVSADLSLIGNSLILNEIYINKTMQDLLINYQSIIRDSIKYIGNLTEVNLSDVSIWHQGGINTASGNVNTSTNRLYSDMINVADGNFQWHKLSNDIKIDTGNIYIYDKNKKYLGYKPILILSPLKVDELLLEYPNFMYVRFAFIAPSDTELIPSMIGIDISWDNVKILPFDKKTILDQVEENTKDIANNKQSILYGKKLVACGDSFTYGSFSSITDENGLKGKDSPELWDSEYNCWKSYSYWVAKRNGMKYINDGIGGSTIAYIESHSAKDNAFSVQRYKNIPSDADYITLKFGINDGHQNVTLGTINDTDNTTFYGAWNVVLKYLVENFPFAKIGVIISNGLDYNELADATIECCKKWGIPYLDEVYDTKVPLLHRVNRPNVNSSVKTAKLEAFRISTSDTHPNPKAHQYESTFVENWLKSL